VKPDGYYLNPLGGAVQKGGRPNPANFMVAGGSYLLATQEGAALSTVANTAATTAFTTPFVPPTLAKNILRVGAALTFKMWGVYRTTGTPTLALSCRLDDATSGSTPNLGLVAFTTIATLTAGWTAQFGLVCISVGAGGTCGTMVGTSMFSVASTLSFVLASDPFSGITVNTTVAHTVEAAITWGAADPLNSITLQGFTLSLAYPITAE
jgi:hypothetical protein